MFFNKNNAMKSSDFHFLRRLFFINIFILKQLKNNNKFLQIYYYYIKGYDVKCL
jgi:hypothetical protein